MQKETPTLELLDGPHLVEYFYNIPSLEIDNLTANQLIEVTTSYPDIND